MALPVAGFFMGMVAPLVRKALVILGVGVVTYTGFQVVLDNFINQIKANMGQLGQYADLAALIGFQQSVGIILGAVAARISLMTLKRFQIL